MDKPHKFSIDMHKRGANGFKRIDDKPQTMRGLEIPSESSLAAKLGKIVNSKQEKKKRP